MNLPISRGRDLAGSLDDQQNMGGGLIATGQKPFKTIYNVNYLPTYLHTYIHTYIITYIYKLQYVQGDEHEHPQLLSQL